MGWRSRGERGGRDCVWGGGGPRRGRDRRPCGGARGDEAEGLPLGPLCSPPLRSLSDFLFCSTLILFPSLLSPFLLLLSPRLPPLFVGRRQDGFVVQTGDPEGPDEGFRDPKTGEIRT